MRAIALLAPPKPENAHTWALGMPEREFFGRNYACPACGVPPGDYRVIRPNWMRGNERALYCTSPTHPVGRPRGPFDVEVVGWDPRT